MYPLGRGERRVPGTLRVPKRLVASYGHPRDPGGLADRGTSSACALPGTAAACSLVEEVGADDARDLEAPAQLQRQLAVGRANPDDPSVTPGFGVHHAEKRKKLILDRHATL